LSKIDLVKVTQFLASQKKICSAPIIEEIQTKDSTFLPLLKNFSLNPWCVYALYFGIWNVDIKTGHKYLWNWKKYYCVSLFIDMMLIRIVTQYGWTISKVFNDKETYVLEICVLKLKNKFNKNFYVYIG